MKYIGAVIFFIGITLAGYAYTMKMYTYQPAKYTSEGEYAKYIPARIISDISSLNKQQKFFIGAGVTSILGLMLFVFPVRREKNSEIDTKKNNEQYSEDFINDTYIITLKKEKDFVFSDLKKMIVPQYTSEYLSDIKIDKESLYLAKREEGEGYLQIEEKIDKVIISAFKAKKPIVSI